MKEYIQASSSTSAQTSSAWWMLQLSRMSTLQGPGYGLVRGIWYCPDQPWNWRQIDKHIPHFPSRILQISLRSPSPWWCPMWSTHREWGPGGWSNNGPEQNISAEHTTYQPLPNLSSGNSPLVLRRLICEHEHSRVWDLSANFIHEISM